MPTKDQHILLNRQSGGGGAIVFPPPEEIGGGDGSGGVVLPDADANAAIFTLSRALVATDAIRFVLRSPANMAKTETGLFVGHTLLADTPMTLIQAAAVTDIRTTPAFSRPYGRADIAVGSLNFLVHPLDDRTKLLVGTPGSKMSRGGHQIIGCRHYQFGGLMGAAGPAGIITAENDPRIDGDVFAKSPNLAADYLAGMPSVTLSESLFGGEFVGIFYSRTLLDGETIRPELIYKMPNAGSDSFYIFDFGFSINELIAFNNPDNRFSGLGNFAKYFDVYKYSRRVPAAA